jgi:ribulose-phosphate 3-epimerase
MTEVIPALMASDLQELRWYFKEFADLVETVQLDVMDGVYVPPTSFPYNNIEEFELLVSSNESLSQSGLNFEVDLMIENPAENIEDWLKVGAERIIVHVEGLENFDEIVESVKKYNESSSDSDVTLGVAIGTTTENDGVTHLIEKADFVQFMGIETIGYQGTEFDERVIDKIADLRKHYPDHIISVDGAVDVDTAPALIAAGATRLVSGSAILESKDRKSVIEALARA